MPGSKFESRRITHYDSLEWRLSYDMRWAPIFDSRSGTEMLALYAVELDGGGSPPIELDAGEAVLYGLAGSGTVDIAETEFALEAGEGCHVREGEWFSLRPNAGETFSLLVAICPGGARPPWADVDRPGPAPGAAFDKRHPNRVASPGNARRETSGDRYFKVLVGPQIGSSAVTQFIGSIPRSKAHEHYHLYEEVILVLSGEGRIWMGDRHAPVRPGSLVFLPREQPHCMECTVDEGMELLGMFYPAGSPAINYPSYRRRGS